MGVVMTPHSQTSNLLLLHQGLTLAGRCHDDVLTAGRQTKEEGRLGGRYY